MILINKQQANWIADLLESGHIHYELKNQQFENAFFQNGVFVEELDDRQSKDFEVHRYSREEFVKVIMSRPRVRFSRFLDMVNWVIGWWVGSYGWHFNIGKLKEIFVSIISVRWMIKWIESRASSFIVLTVPSIFLLFPSVKLIVIVFLEIYIKVQFFIFRFEWFQHWRIKELVPHHLFALLCFPSW